MIRMSVLFALVVLLGSGAQDPKDELWAPFGRPGEESVQFERICRYDVVGSAQPLATLDWIAVHGGLTCHAQGQGRIYSPLRDQKCPILSGVKADAPRTLPRLIAAREFQECTALGSFEERGGSDGVIVFEVIGDSPEREIWWMFTSDLTALALIDLLAVEHISSANGLVCVKALDRRLVLDHLRTADIIDEANLRVHQQYATCAEAAEALTGQPFWPRRVPDGS